MSGGRNTDGVSIEIGPASWDSAGASALDSAAEQKRGAVAELAEGLERSTAKSRAFGA